MAILSKVIVAASTVAGATAVAADNSENANRKILDNIAESGPTYSRVANRLKAKDQIAKLKTTLPTLVAEEDQRKNANRKILDNIAESGPTYSQVANRLKAKDQIAKLKTTLPTLVAEEDQRKNANRKILDNIAESGPTYSQVANRLKAKDNIHAKDKVGKWTENSKDKTKQATAMLKRGANKVNQVMPNLEQWTENSKDTKKKFVASLKRSVANPDKAAYASDNATHASEGSYDDDSSMNKVELPSGGGEINDETAEFIALENRILV